MAIEAQLYSENLGFPFGDGYSSRDWMENGYEFNDLSFFHIQQQPQQNKKQKHEELRQQLQPESFQEQRNQDLCFGNGFLETKNYSNNTNQSMPMISQSIAAELEKQKQEIDQSISLHNQRLRLALQEHRKQQLTTILKKYQLKSQSLLSQKDKEIVKAMNKTVELQNFLRRTEIEIQNWQKVAEENEEIAMDLNNKIENLREKCCFSMNGEAEDAESCCERDDGNREMVCKNCFSQNSSVVFLPCRHICSCKSCEVFLESCPVCRMVKKASIQVLF